MSSDASTPSTPPASVPATTPTISARRAPVAKPRPRLGRWLGLLAVILIATTGSLWAMGIRPSQLWSRSGPTLETVEVDRGDVLSSVTESGALESADNATVRCQVEALMGMVSSATGGLQTGGAGGGGRGGGGSGGTSSSNRSTSTVASTSSTTSSASKSTASTGSSASGAGSSGSGGASAGGGMAKSSVQTPSASSGGIIQKPVIQSFTYVVTPHVPLRPAATTSTTSTRSSAPANSAFSRGGGGGGGDQQDRGGSTTILKILEEGTPVKAGDIVCWLDDSAFRDELQAQLIRWAQAKSWVEQAQSILEVSQIALDEYKNGIYKRDIELINQYIQTCGIQLRQAQDTLAYSRSLFEKHLYSEQQVRSAEYGLQRSELALREARTMRDRLVKHTAPKIIVNLEAKIEAVRADLLAQEEAFKREDERKRRLERAIANCKMVAPRDGLVVYANEANGWGRVETQIREGLAVRENQSIFMVPNPKNMRVKVKVNESKVSMIQPGERALIRVDAFPDQPLYGTVAEVTVIPTAAAGPFSDVKIYYAMVDIDQGFEGLRTGMSAEVEFLIDSRINVTRVPVQAVRWFERNPFVAVKRSRDEGLEWRPLKLGLMNSAYAEVLSGLEPGQEVIADPASLPPPSESEREEARLKARVASSSEVDSPRS